MRPNHRLCRLWLAHFQPSRRRNTSSLEKPRQSPFSTTPSVCSLQRSVAVMRSTLKQPAPSATLLRFLRSQSEGLCFFSLNPRPVPLFDHGPRTRPHSTPPSKSSCRRLSTTSPCAATIESGFLNLDFLWPRATTSSNLTACQYPSSRRGPDDYLPTSKRVSNHRSFHLWRRKQKREGSSLKPDDLPSSEGNSHDSMFSLGSRISAKAASEPKLRCTECDENGNVVLVNEEFKKSELIAKVSSSFVLWTRDLQCSMGFCHEI